MIGQGRQRDQRIDVAPQFAAGHCNALAPAWRRGVVDAVQLHADAINVRLTDVVWPRYPAAGRWRQAASPAMQKRQARPGPVRQRGPANSREGGAGSSWRSSGERQVLMNAL